MNAHQAVVNEAQCVRIAEIIKKLSPEPGFYQREYLTLKAPEEVRFRMHFFAVAICHHTYTLHHPQLDLWGWDFIEHVFVRMAQQQTQLLDPAYLANGSPAEVAGELARWFSHDERHEQCSLDRLDERAALMIDAAKLLIQKFDGSLQTLFERSGGRLLNDQHGLYEVLPRFEAFSDPLQKKSTFLIKLLMDAGMIEIYDALNFIPIMDYHMQRVLLRTGCVEVTDRELREKLLRRDHLPSDEPVRSRCIDAFRIIADVSGKPVTRMNDYFWSLGRSCCNNTALCHDHFCEKTPCTLSQIIQLGAHRHCIFESVCPGAKSEKYRQLWQPVVTTHFY
jgi:hypothetical protein